jgi:hypothetical protein
LTFAEVEAWEIVWGIGGDAVEAEVTGVAALIGLPVNRMPLNRHKLKGILLIILQSARGLPLW